MREWKLKAGDPMVLSLAADARLGSTDYCDDQIWELSLSEGEPPAVGIKTTFGLRARSFRLFYRFQEGEQTWSDPAVFASPPLIRQFYPNFMLVSFNPAAGLEAEAEFWIPSSQSAYGRLRLANTGSIPRQVKVELVVMLVPAETGERMMPQFVDKVPVLTGRTGTLFPLVLLQPLGQSSASPYPSFSQVLTLEPGRSGQLAWVEAARDSVESSFQLAQQVISRNWDAEQARLERRNDRLVEIHTGAPDWDAAFSLAQKVALGLFLDGQDNLPHPSFVLSRQPDQGYSLRGNGSDYNHLWNGQTPLDAYFLSQVLLPAEPEQMEGVLRNFIETAEENGQIDWKPGLGGQRTQLLATPILASLADRIYQETGDLSFLEDIFPTLLAFVNRWFHRQNDRDEDGIPEWAHPAQSGFEDHPLFAYWLPGAQGAEISAAETPSLCSFLYRECQTLLKFARLLGRSDEVAYLQVFAENLRTAVEVAWDSAQSTYQAWDRDSHYSTTGEDLGERQGPGEMMIARTFDHPIRMLVKINLGEESSRQFQVFIHGNSPSGQHIVERLPAEHFDWSLRSGTKTGERVYRTVDRVVIEGSGESVCIRLQSVDYHCLEHTLLLPLWAKIPAPERAKALVEATLTRPDLFWKPFGIPTCANSQYDLQPEICQAVNLPWNALLCEGLLSYGFIEQAADLFARHMESIIQSLKTQQAFRKQYHALSGIGMGERNALEGLPPVGLFLDILGVRLVSPKKVVLRGSNPFPWPVTVKYQGLTILRQAEKTVVVFPDGQAETVSGPDSCTISLE